MRSSEGRGEIKVFSLGLTGGNDQTGLERFETRSHKIGLVLSPCGTNLDATRLIWKPFGSGWDHLKPTPTVPGYFDTI